MGRKSSRTSSRAEAKPKPHEQALGQLRAHYLLGPVAEKLDFWEVSRYQVRPLPAGAYCQVDTAGKVCFDGSIKLSPAQWLGIFALVTLVVAIGGTRRLAVPARVSDLAAQLGALHWWHQLRIGELPEHFDLPPEILQWGRQPIEEIAARLNAEPPDEVLDGRWTLTRSEQPLMLPAPAPARWVRRQPVDHEQIFAQALVENAKRALQLQHEVNQTAPAGRDPNSTGARAKRWLIAHYPLLGALLTHFKLVEDAEVCERLRIHIAAIQIGTGEIYLNPRRQLGPEQAKFVLAHEILHAGLNHAGRRQGRDPYLWNVACDFVINDWLVGMQLGTAPEGGLLFDEELRGQPAEDIYLRLAADLRVRRRLSTLRGDDVDMLDDRPGSFFTDREEFCRRALLQGLDYHQASGRGLLPAGLVEAIRVLNQPAIPWQAQLAEWIQERCPLPERRRTWARPSRRQSATPETPRPRFIVPEDEQATRTYGVIVDTSGSMDRMDLGKALGAIVAYSQAQGVRQVRLVYCDAQPYDEGYVPVDALAARVQVRGRGGTVLQAAVNLLQGQKDFARDCPILIITDGFCESDLQVARDHAFLVSPGMRLPFATRKPVFHMR
jgi:predicted metal-dependent peptidase